MSVPLMPPACAGCDVALARPFSDPVLPNTTAAAWLGPRTHRRAIPRSSTPWWPGASPQIPRTGHRCDLGSSVDGSSSHMADTLDGAGPHPPPISAHRCDQVYLGCGAALVHLLDCICLWYGGASTGLPGLTLQWPPHTSQALRACSCGNVGGMDLYALGFRA